MLALPSRNSNTFSRFSRLSEAVKKFVIAAICLTATLASSAPAKDKKYIQAAQDALVYQGPQCGSPLGTASSFYIHRAVSHHCTAAHCSAGRFSLQAA